MYIYKFFHFFLYFVRKLLNEDAYIKNKVNLRFNKNSRRKKLPTYWGLYFTNFLGGQKPTITQNARKQQMI